MENTLKYKYKISPKVIYILNNVITTRLLLIAYRQTECVQPQLSYTKYKQFSHYFVYKSTCIQFLYIHKYLVLKEKKCFLLISLHIILPNFKIAIVLPEEISASRICLQEMVHLKAEGLLGEVGEEGWGQKGGLWKGACSSFSSLPT